MDLRGQIMGAQPEERIWALRVQPLMSKYTQKQMVVVVERCCLKAGPSSVLFIRAVKDFLGGIRWVSSCSLRSVTPTSLKQ